LAAAHDTAAENALTLIKLDQELQGDQLRDAS
jgi:hypothetical protein